MSVTQEAQEGQVAAKHTPGPWELWEGHLEIFGGPLKENTRGGIRGGSGQICELDELICGCEDPYETHDEHDRCPTALANAALICAAPDYHAAARGPEADVADIKWASAFLTELDGDEGALGEAMKCSADPTAFYHGWTAICRMVRNLDAAYIKAEGGSK